MLMAMPQQTLRWAASTIGADPANVEAQTLRSDHGPWLLNVTVSNQQLRAVLRVGDSADHQLRQRFATEAAALTVAARHAVPAPRLIAVDLTGRQTATLAILTTALPGNSLIPASRPRDRLRRLGAVAARLHAISLPPSDRLPLRSRPLPDVDFVAHRAASGTTSLLTEAETRLDQLSVPTDRSVFVHGDLWLGNTMWTDGEFSGVVDWDCAGAGPPGIDIGTLRFDAATLFGTDAADDILDGYQAATGQPVDHIAYWDVVAGSCTLADMAYCLANLHQRGRADLDADTLNARRDQFLAGALQRLHPH
jgi:aminoglycoside phosphotransferase (APT) family kinase protein